MRILIASDLYPPAVNGVSTFTYNLANGLASSGHEVMVIAPSQHRHSHREHAGDLTIHRVSSIPFKLYPIRLSLLPAGDIAAVYRSFRPDVVHVQTLLEIGRNSLLIARHRRIPVVITHHAMPENIFENLGFLLPFREPFKQVMRLYSSHLSRRAYYVTTPTQLAADTIRLNVAEDRMRVISNGIDTDRFRPGKADEALRKAYGLPNEPVILYVGRLDKEKHLDTLVRAISLARRKAKLHCLIIGKGNMSQPLRELSSQLGVAHNITFAGFVDDSILDQAYRLGSMFVMTSPAEMQSITMLEAMASGLPIAAVHAGALPELCQDGKNGRLFNTDDASELSNLMLEMLADPKRLKTMATVSRQIAVSHSFDKTQKAFTSLYEELLSQSEV